MVDDPQFHQEFEQEISKIEDSLGQLKERYQQVKQDQQELKQLQQRRAQIKKGRRKIPPSYPLQEELTQIEAQIDLLNLTLESRLFNWKSLQEPFWQIVRFTGLGIILGWILKSLVGY